MKMKIFTRTLSLLVIASLTLFFANCGGDDPSAPPEKGQLDKLSKTWTVTSVTDKNGARNDFAGMTLTISGPFNESNPNGPYNYSVGGTLPTPSPWPKPGETAGKWEFVAVEDGLIVRDPGTVDALGMTYTLTGSALKIEFNLDGSDGWAGGKVLNVDGDWVFNFN